MLYRLNFEKNGYGISGRYLESSLDSGLLCSSRKGWTFQGETFVSHDMRASKFTIQRPSLADALPQFIPAKNFSIFQASDIVFRGTMEEDIQAVWGVRVDVLHELADK